MTNAVAIRSAIAPLQHYEAMSALIAAAGDKRHFPFNAAGLLDRITLEI